MSASTRISSGVPGLDKMLKGGLPQRRTILVSGTTGTGKTTLAAQFIHRGARAGEPGVFVTLEEDKDKIAEDLASLNLEIAKLRGFNLLGGSIADILRYQAKVRANWRDFIDEVEEVVRSTKAKRVAIDSINLFLMMIKGEDDRRTALLMLTDRLNKLGCTTLLTCETRDSSTLSWYGFEEFVVDGVIQLMIIPFETYYEWALAVRKLRGSDHDKGIVAYRIGPTGFEVFPEQYIIQGSR